MVRNKINTGPIQRYINRKVGPSLPPYFSQTMYFREIKSWCFWTDKSGKALISLFPKRGTGCPFCFLFLSHSWKTDRTNLLAFWPTEFSVGKLGASDFHSDRGLATRQNIYPALATSRITVGSSASFASSSLTRD
jgi:hypothetical protein